MITSSLRALWAEPGAAHPPAVGWRDQVLVAVVLVTALLEGAFREDVTWRPFVTLVTVGLAPMLLWRRSHPLRCVAVAFGAGLVLGLAGQFAGTEGVGLHSMAFILVFVHALVRWGSGRQIVIGLAVVAVAAVSSIATDYTGPAELFGGLAVLVAAAAGGAALRYRAESWRRALDQIRSQERVGLARELHDSVAHHVSAITVQAQAGRTMARKRPEAALEALAVIETEALRTLAEMRSMVRVLRDGAPAPLAPQLGVADLVALARREPTPAIDIQVAADLGEIPSQVDAAAYRIGQEALTNALRHSRSASRVKIVVTTEARSLRLRVSDDGQSDPVRPAVHGFGLLGMAERVNLLGGTLHAGPAPEGGWAVDARLPMGIAR